MKKILWLIIFLLLNSTSTNTFAAPDINNPLPNWIDTAREKADGNPPLLYSKEIPPKDFRIPAEYEPISAVVIGWAGYTDILTSIAKAVTGPGQTEIWAVSGPAHISGVPDDKYIEINVPINTVWMRDYGPFGVSNGQLGIVDSVYRHYQYRRKDDALPSNLGKIQNIEVFGIPIILDGGNIMVDSKANLFMTKRTYTWNPNLSKEEVDAALKSYFKVKNIYAFDYAGYPGYPEDGTGHIDMFLKLLNDYTVLVSVADTEPFRTAAEKAIAFFEKKTAPGGVPYKIIKVKGWKKYGAWYTYTNSLIVNNTVLMPSYSGYNEENAQSEAAYKAGMPGITVIPINSSNSISAGGSIHCVTQTIPAVSNRKRAQKSIPFPKPTKTDPQNFLENMIINWDNLTRNK
ncbi:MAG: agmatine deiminase family protein [Elusimicrobia bacterium]|nr:agmatine deiminase family protein [Elusimicrobiota bacterium]